MSKFNATDKYDRKVRGGPEYLVCPNSKVANQWFGLTQCVSVAGGITATVSTALVASFSVLTLTLYSQTGASSGQTPFQFGVRTISHGGFFQVGAINSTVIVGSYQVAWEIRNPVQ